ncbi:aspartate--tRNA ligase [candidate division WOR-3 bacterium]|uniref:Aspartate--tRNA ligase n=1 Tax=candidate division WOR-3 bacterium TaxID=2052148 RepID=A0A9D5K8C4_UNCW3|nr:aspartate--tRNA ligase [candidate division WOR-3 bacterium]MBD3364308.1 aspartate--tRNA ligase [candidate division WOR-3 bacterium]
MKRVYCGNVALEHEQKTVRLCGWVHRLRDLGGVTFLHLRDRSGLIQVVCDPKKVPEADEIHAEDVIEIKGKVSARPSDQVDERLHTGKVEVAAEKLTVLNRACNLPFSVEREELLPAEEMRLRYRYLDLRRPEMTAYMGLRHRMMHLGRNYLAEAGYWEIETPILARSTPEGARDFLVPSRQLKGKFYALPQSPQLYKQILMVSGMDRYFQWARCLRDEDLRADRQLEHTQIDIEASFADEKEIQTLVEGLFAVWSKELNGEEIKTPFPPMTYADAIERFGSDKPDIRNPLEIRTVTEKFTKSEFRIFAQVVEQGGTVRSLTLPDGARLSRKELDTIAEEVKPFGFPGVAWVKKTDGLLSGPLSKFTEGTDLKEGNLELCLGGKDAKNLNQAMGRLRDVCGKRLDLVDEADMAALWVTDFPMFELDEDSGRIVPAHHIFTSPRDEDLEYLEKDPLKVRGRLFDIVLNGWELGSGSVRCHDTELQKKLLKIAGLNPAHFDFFLKALEAGAPPHAGIGMGFDRIVAIYAGLDSIRDTIAFPKTTSGQGLMEGQPSGVEESQLNELGIKVRKIQEDHR